MAVQQAMQAAVVRAMPEDGLAPPALFLPESTPVCLEPTLPGGDPGALPVGEGEVALRRLAPGAADGERKLVALFGCILASTPALCKRLGLDGLHKRMRALYALVLQDVQ